MRRESQLSQTGLKAVQSLQTFKLLPSEIAPIYYDASSLPPFLQNNLKSQHRIIKQFQGDDSILKAFYFNLMKLAFEIECEQTDYVGIIKKILLSQQEFGMGELEDKNLTDNQYRKFLLEFISILQNQEIPSFEETIQWYPIVDQILLKMFKKLVPVTLLLKDTSDYSVATRILEFLSQKFQMKMQVISGCFKFIDSDIFVYIQNFSHIFVVYVDQLAFIREVTEQASSHLENNSKITSHQEQSQKVLEDLHSPEHSKNYSKHLDLPEDRRVRSSFGQESSLSGREKHRAFNTVINMLDSKYSSTDKSHMTTSLKYRSSFDNNLQNIQRSRFDKVKEKDALFEDYYGIEQNRNKFQAQISSLSTIKGQQSVNSNRSSILADCKSIQEMKSVGIPFRENKNEMFHTTIHRDSNFNRDSLQKIWKEPSIIPKSLENKTIVSHCSPKIVCKSKDKCQIKRTLNIVIKPLQQYSREMTSPGNSKNSNLSLFSKVNKKGSFHVEPLKASKKEEEISDQDNSYQKFTNSGLLEILDEQYKAQIKSIKQKYREHRNNVKKYI